MEVQDDLRRYTVEEIAEAGEELAPSQRRLPPEQGRVIKSLIIGSLAAMKTGTQY
jgi:hypothetical protein